MFLGFFFFLHFTTVRLEFISLWALGIHYSDLLIILQVKTAVRRVFCSYLSLLVNSKNDMALAHTLDVPGRCLGRGAFRDLRRAAEEGNTSLFLVTNAQTVR